ncbi:potassium channel family protein [Pontibacter sp. SGAir0037]|uniref:potassium channel family protein n=1 Tax=Pontibacter sp. SGAir0037 TaxID=2571030 RepID=UPI0010CCC868|nr:potassium channel family protein [Pontibacter sp. SGAir0037]QCR21910.1 hypothetical protein C1N53_05870 [Pontibacter sp. SGAir0037]
MNLFLFVAGVFIMSLAVYDLLYTTFSPHGAGPLSGKITTFIWGIFFKVSQKLHNRNFLNAAGICIVCGVLINWVLFVWIGNALVFASYPGAVVNSVTSEAATYKEVIYYTGYILSTMGNGDFVASTGGWKIYSAIISFSGLILITIAVTYMVPVLSAITERRTLSILIASLGSSAQSILLNHWKNGNFRMLELPLSQITADIARQGQLQLSYPVLHYFHNSEKLTALLPNLAELDEALSIMLIYIPEHLHPQPQYLVPARKAISSFLDTLTNTFLDPAEEISAPLPVDELRKSGIPTLTPLQERLAQLDKRRKILKSMLLNDGWSLEDLNKPVFRPDLDLPEMLSE